MPAHYVPPQTLPIDPLLTVNDIAQTLRRSRGYVYELVREEELHPIRIGEHLRFSAADVRAYLHRLGLEEGDGS